MGIEDRDWRKEEIKQQRQTKKISANPSRRNSALSVEQFLANDLKKRRLKPKSSRKPNMFIMLFLLIFSVSAAFLLYQYLLYMP